MYKNNLTSSECFRISELEKSIKELKNKISLNEEYYLDERNPISRKLLEDKQYENYFNIYQKYVCAYKIFKENNLISREDLDFFEIEIGNISCCLDGMIFCEFNDFISFDSTKS